jgi:hypothetical protein
MKQILLFTLLLAFTASAFEFTGKVVGVADGDTITVLAEGNKQYKVRFQHIDCPEVRQPFGSKAKRFLSQKVFGKSVTVKWDEMDRCKRILGNVYLGEEWVNLELGKAKAAKRGVITSARSWIALIHNASSVASAMQPAIVHLRDFGVQGFTSGCVCIAPSLSMKMLAVLKAGDYETAETIRQTFEPLENLRNAINPIRVLHTAVAEAGIADTGPILPLLNDVSENERANIADAAKTLLVHN